MHTDLDINEVRAVQAHACTVYLLLAPLIYRPIKLPAQRAQQRQAPGQQLLLEGHDLRVEPFKLKGKINFSFNRG
jgi:hypothetical protein